MSENRKAINFIVMSALIASLYVSLTLAFAPISFKAVQFRIAEALTILPLFTPAAIPGLFIGCLIANLLGGAIMWDVIFGSLATLIGAWLGYRLRSNRWLVPIPAIIANTIIVPLVIKFGYGDTMPLLLLMVYIFIGEVGGCYVLGELLATALQRVPFPQQLQQQ